MSLGLSNTNILAVVTDFVCGYCMAKTGYNIVYADRCELYSEYGDFLDGQGFAVLECRICKMLNFVTLKVIEDLERPVAPFFDENLYLAQNPKVVHTRYDPDSRSIQPVFLQFMGQFPTGLRMSDEIPLEIQSDLKEAARCLCVDAPNAALLMCRKSIERVCIYLGIASTKSTLGGILQSLQSTGKIAQSVIEDFQEIKEWGNIGAHVKDTEYVPVELFEAQKVFNLTLLVVDRLFNQTNRDSIRTLREQKKKQSSDTTTGNSTEDMPF